MRARREKVEHLQCFYAVFMPIFFRLVRVWEDDEQALSANGIVLGGGGAALSGPEMHVADSPEVLAEQQTRPTHLAPPQSPSAMMARQAVIATLKVSEECPMTQSAEVVARLAVKRERGRMMYPDILWYFHRPLALASPPSSLCPDGCVIREPRIACTIRRIEVASPNLPW